MKRRNPRKGQLTNNDVEVYYTYQKALLESLSKNGFMSQKQCEDCIVEIKKGIESQNKTS